MVHQIHVLQVVEVVHAQQLFGRTFPFRERGGLGLFLNGVVVPGLSCGMMELIR